MFIFEKAKEVGFSLKYKFYGYLNAVQLDKSPDSAVWLLGHRMPTTTPAQIQHLRQLFLRNVWVTYTRGFQPLQNGLTTDSGWGCMLRTGQMQLSVWLSLHLGVQFCPKKMMGLLKDNDGVFGIANIAKEAKQMFQMDPGAWYNPSQIIYCIQQLAAKLQPIEFSHLRISVMNSGVLIFQNLLKESGITQFCECFQQEQKIVFCQKHMKWGCSVAVIVLCRIGLERPQEKYLKVLESMFQIEQFSGVIGGRPQSALFMMGKNNRKFVYMDPHYVRGAITNEYIQSHSQFGCPEIREMASSKIDCSLGITFYIRDGQELNSFYSSIQAIKKDNEDNMFIFSEKKTPEYMKDSI